MDDQAVEIGPADLPPSDEPAATEGDGEVRPRSDPGCAAPGGRPCGIPITPEGGDIVAATALDDGIVAAVTRSGEVAVFEAPLQPRWQVTALPYLGTDGTATLIVDDQVVLVAANRQVVALALVDGREQWRTDLLAGRGPSSAALDLATTGSGEVLVHQPATGFVAVLDGDTGRQRWRASEMPAAGLTRDGVVSVWRGQVALYITGSQPEWVRPLPSVDVTPKRLRDDARPGDLIVLEGRSGALALDPATGETLLGDNEVVTGARAVGGILVAQVTDEAEAGPGEQPRRELRGVDRDGELRWAVATGPIGSPPVFVPTPDGRQVAVANRFPQQRPIPLFDLADGTLVKEIPTRLDVGFPIALTAGTAVWEQAGMLTGTSIEDGSPQWQTVRGAEVIANNPLVVLARGQLWLVDDAAPNAADDHPQAAANTPPCATW